MDWIDLKRAAPQDGEVVLVWRPDNLHHVELVRYQAEQGFCDLQDNQRAEGTVTHWMPIENS